MKIKINGKVDNWNCKTYGNINKEVKIYFGKEEMIFSPNQWDQILEENKIDNKTLEKQSLITELHSKFNQAFYVLGDFKLDAATQKRELKLILGRLTEKVKDKQLLLAFNIFISVNFDDNSNFHKKK